MQASDTRYGPVFRWVTRWSTIEPRRLSAGGVLLILRRRAELAGIEGAGERISPHSLRAGFAAYIRHDSLCRSARLQGLSDLVRYRSGPVID